MRTADYRPHRYRWVVSKKSEHDVVGTPRLVLFSSASKISSIPIVMCSCALYWPLTRGVTAACTSLTGKNALVQLPHLLSRRQVSAWSPVTPSVAAYIVRISSILGLLPLVPAGDHGTIPATMRNSKSQLFKCWVLQGRAPREWQQALLHQSVGNVLAL